MGSWFIEAGWPVHQVQEMLDHADLKQTSTYLNVTLDGLKASMRAMDEARRCKIVVSSAAKDQRLPRQEEARKESKPLSN